MHVRGENEVRAGEKEKTRKKGGYINRQGERKRVEKGESERVYKCECGTHSD